VKNKFTLFEEVLGLNDYKWETKIPSVFGSSLFPSLGIPTPNRFFVFSPHPDDAGISLGGLLILAVRGGISTCSVLMTDGSEAVIPRGFLSRHGWCPGMSPSKLRYLRGAIRVEEAREEARRLGLPGEAVILLQQQNWFEAHRTPSEAMNPDWSIRDVDRFRPGPLEAEAIKEIQELIEAGENERVLCAVPSPNDRLLMHRMTILAVVKALTSLISCHPNRYSILIYRCFSTEGWVENAEQRILGFGKEVMDRKCHAILASQSMKARREVFGGYTNRGNEFYDVIVRSENAATARRNGLSSPYAECFQWYDIPGSSLWANLVRETEKDIFPVFS
jgi:LmbE family N-acetylglucosaminyl deacetylase